METTVDARRRHAALRAQVAALTPAHERYTAARMRSKALRRVAAAARLAAALAAAEPPAPRRRSLRRLLRGRKQARTASTRAPRAEAAARLEGEARELEVELEAMRGEVAALQGAEELWREAERELDRVEREVAGGVGVGAAEEAAAEALRRARIGGNVEVLRAARVDDLLAAVRRGLETSQLRDAAAAVRRAEDAAAEVVRMQPELPLRRARDGRVLLGDDALKARGRRLGFRRSVRLAHGALAELSNAEAWNARLAADLVHDRDLNATQLRVAEAVARAKRKAYLAASQ